MFKINANELTDEELKEYWITLSKCFETDEIACMTGKELEETELYEEAMCVQNIFTERGLMLPR